MTDKDFCAALERLGLRKQREVAAFLGIAQPKVSLFKSGVEKIPKYIAISVQGHLLLNQEQIETLKQLRGV